MFNAMLVDDEQMALEGLRLLIDWEAEGFRVCAECRSAPEALEAMDERKPDLVVTDLTMPEMDGIAMMRAMRERGFDGRFIIISGYADFEKAKSAMDLGVCGYILKPIDSSEASETIKRAHTELLERDLRGRRALPLEHTALTAILNGGACAAGTLPDEATWRLMTWGAPLPCDKSARLAEQLAGKCAAVTVHIIDGWEWLLARDLAQDEAISELEREAVDMGRELRVSDALRSDELRAACLSLRGAKENDEALLRQTSALADAISLRKTDDAARISDELEAMCAAQGRDARKRVCTALRMSCGQQLADEPERLDEFLEHREDDIKATAMLAIRLLAPTNERASDMIKAYCDKHYMERGLTLEQIASDIGYHATYLSRVFREETGEGFRDWLTKLRVEKAASLLDATRMSVCEIAEAVGYAQYKLLLIHFKHRFHTTPEGYRRRRVNP